MMAVFVSLGLSILAQALPANAAEITAQNRTDVEQIARSTTVRVLSSTTSGSGVIVQHQGQTYWVLTNWHVIEQSDRPTVLTSDGRSHSVLSTAQQLGRVDLALIQFRSSRLYPTASLSARPVTVGEPVYAAGFPMYHQDFSLTLEDGIRGFRLTKGRVSLWLVKTLPLGYRLGYTNPVIVGMSGGPIFNQQGHLIGINGRMQDRDPAFGSYIFEDGTEPNPMLQQQMARSSFGIPITTYLQLLSSYIGR